MTPTKKDKTPPSRRPTKGPKITKIVPPPLEMPLDVPSPKVLHTTRELKTYLSEKLYVYHKILGQLQKHPELLTTSTSSVHNIQGKLELIEDLRKTYGWDELRRRPPVTELVL